MRLRNCLAGKMGLMGWLTRVVGPDLGASAVRVYLLKDLSTVLVVCQGSDCMRSVYLYILWCTAAQRRLHSTMDWISLCEVSKSYIYC